MRSLWHHVRVNVIRSFFLWFSTGASFAEHFYGLKRYVDEGSQSKVLPRQAHWKSLILLVCYYIFTHTHIPLHHRKMEKNFGYGVFINYQNKAK